MSKSLVPGDQVGKKYVLAFLPRGMVLCSNGFVYSRKMLEPEGERLVGFPIKSEASKILLKEGMTLPGLDDLRVGDGLLLIENRYVRVALVAVVDRERKMVFTEDGEIVPLNSMLVAKSGWRTEETDLLTEEGREELRKFYS